MKSFNPHHLINLAVATGATSPSPTDGTGSIIWSTSTSSIMTWNGSNWQPTTTRSLIDTAASLNSTSFVLGDGAPTSLSAANNTIIGHGAGASISTSTFNVLIGSEAGDSITSGSGSNVAVGYQALAGTTTKNANVAIGHQALQSEGTWGNNVAVGPWAMQTTNGANNSVGIGYQALKSATTGNNVAIGYRTQLGNSTGSSDNNVAVGSNSMSTTFTGACGGNTAVGTQALQNLVNGTNNTAVGYNSLNASSFSYSNCSALGYSTAVTASNQVQLGNSSTTTYVYGTVQTRSDARDKADIVDNPLGLTFILELRPRQFRWDFREDYYDVVYDEIPGVQEEVDDSGNVIVSAQEGVKIERRVRKDRDGSKKRGRLHNGLIAQEVQEAMNRLGVDFAGYQDHSIAGGEDVLSIGYEELIAPMIKAIQELHAKNQTLEARLAAIEAKIGSQSF